MGVDSGGGVEDLTPRLERYVFYGRIYDVMLVLVVLGLKFPVTIEPVRFYAYAYTTISQNW